MSGGVRATTMHNKTSLPKYKQMALSSHIQLPTPTNEQKGASCTPLPPDTALTPHVRAEGCKMWPSHPA